MAELHHTYPAAAPLHNPHNPLGCLRLRSLRPCQMLGREGHGHMPADQDAGHLESQTIPN